MCFREINVLYWEQDIPIPCFKIKFVCVCLSNLIFFCTFCTVYKIVNINIRE